MGTVIGVFWTRNDDDPTVRVVSGDDVVVVVRDNREHVAGEEHVLVPDEIRTSHVRTWNPLGLREGAQDVRRCSEDPQDMRAPRVAGGRRGALGRAAERS